MTKEEANAALFNAAEDGEVEALKAALAAGADVDAKEDICGSTAVFIAAENGNAECVKILIESGADVDVVNGFGDTALGIAERNGYVTCVLILKAAGANSSIKVIEGRIFRASEPGSCIQGDLPELLNVGENDRLMIVRVFVKETSGWNDEEVLFVAIWLKREGCSWKNLCYPVAPDECATGYSDNWNWDEMLDQVWNWETVVYTTKLNDDDEEVESTWKVE